MQHVDPASVVETRSILRGAAFTISDVKRLIKACKRDRAFGWARKLASRARADLSQLAAADRVFLAQQQALCTYKDVDLPPSAALDLALDILSSEENLRETTDQETLGIAGAIFKRKWASENQNRFLERARIYYLRGYEQGVDGDFGYTGINAAYILDVLASQEELEARQAGATLSGVEQKRTQADEIRTDIATRLPDLAAENEWLKTEWWYFATAIEACLGLKKYDEAKTYAEQAVQLSDVPEWEKESTARQLASLIGLRHPGKGSEGTAENEEASSVLVALLGDTIPARSAAYGKVGVALSGGGFRASLFHIGVLAKLAELDILRHVEVISCVSGGSIIGAHYYLEMEAMLGELEDAQITREHYIRLVNRVQRDFLAGVQRNIRTRVAASWLTNLKMMLVPNYSRTLRVGELYEKEIFARIDGVDPDKPIWLNERQIKPKGAKADFAPTKDNWKRAAKVPVLVLNATSLNTGHNWQYTASFMGESPFMVNTDVDGNFRLRRMYYNEEIPDAYRTYRLGAAVAASSCVPGLFEPIALPGLYPDITVRLVDGGVHDNQGTSSLLEQGCDVVIVSDASGQMGAQEQPGHGLLGVPLRSNSILQARIRDAQYKDLTSRRRSSLLRGLTYVHLKKDLEVEPIDWIDCQDPHDESDLGLDKRRLGPLTTYSIQKSVQRKIAAMRTDLDSFSDTEAYALMTSGYCMAEVDIPRTLPMFGQAQPPRCNWDFLTIENDLKSLEGANRLDKQLSVAGQGAFKVWALSTPLKVAAMILAVVAIAVLVWQYEAWWPRQITKLTLGGVVVIAAMAFLSKVFGSTVAKMIQYRKALHQFLLGLAMTAAGFLVARLHLHVFDRLFLRFGRYRADYDALLCHDASARDAVLDVARRLEAEGITTWTEDVVDNGNLASVAVFVSKGSPLPWESPKTDTLLRTMAQNGRRLIPVRMTGDTDPPLPAYFNGAFWIDLARNQADVGALVAAIRNARKNAAA